MTLAARGFADADEPLPVGDLIRILCQELERSSHSVRDGAPDSALDRLHHLACDLAATARLAKVIVVDLELYGPEQSRLVPENLLACVRGLNDALVRARASVYEPSASSMDNLFPARIRRRRERALALVHELDHMSQTLIELIRVMGGRTDAQAAGTVQARRTGCAQWLVKLAVRVIPTAAQARYEEEWRGELWDLAALPRHRRRQLGYALRMLMCAWSVRAAVRKGEPRSAAGG